MKLKVIDHPLVAHKLTVLRDKNTPSTIFRQLVGELITLLAYESTRDVETVPVDIETPIALSPAPDWRILARSWCRFYVPV